MMTPDQQRKCRCTLSHRPTCGGLFNNKKGNAWCENQVGEMKSCLHLRECHANPKTQRQPEEKQ